MTRPWKIGLALAGGAIAYGLYSIFSSKSASAETPQTSSAPGLLPVSSPYPTENVPYYLYTVSTETDPVSIRQGPGLSWPVISKAAKGSTVNATGTTSDNPYDGMTWVELEDAQGAKLGWASLDYLRIKTS